MVPAGPQTPSPILCFISAAVRHLEEDHTHTYQLPPYHLSLSLSLFLADTHSYSTMRSRRQGVLDAVSVLGMDPWKDDRVRDFVAVNTIQRLRAYHLEAGAPMPAIADVNADRALNLLLLPRAEPDYRPCCGERPPTQAELRAKARARRQQQPHKPHRHTGGGDGEEETTGVDTQQVKSPSSTSTSSPAASRTSSATSSVSRSDRDEKEGEEGQTPARQMLSADGSSPSPVATASQHATPSPHCAVDRARALFFGAASFFSSTSPRRLVNSPHVPLTPSVTSPASAVDRNTPRHTSAGATAIATATACVTTTTPASSSSRVDVGPSGTPVGSGEEEREVRAVPSVATRSLHTELDTYIAANSTPLRIPPPLPQEQRHQADDQQNTSSFKQEEEEKRGAAGAAAGAHVADAASSPLSTYRGDDEASREVVNTTTTASADAHPDTDTISPSRPADSAGEEDSEHTISKRDGINDDDAAVPPPLHHRSCDVCDAIVDYFQSMLTRGVVLDRYNHKDLAFAWWVLGRNMDAAALEIRGPMRREALLITIRNLYYGLLSAEEAKTRKAEAAATHRTELPNTPDGASRTSCGSGGGMSEVTASGQAKVKPAGFFDPNRAASTAAEEEKKKGAEDEGEERRKSDGRAAELRAARGSVPLGRPRGRGRTPGSAGAAAQPPPVPPPPPISPLTSTVTTRKRARAAAAAAAAERTEGNEVNKEAEESVRAGKTGASALRLSPALTPARSNKSAEEEAEASMAPLAAALRGDDAGVSSGLLPDKEDANEEDDRSNTGATSLTSSTATSRAGSVAPLGAPSASSSGGRRRRRAEDRRRAVEETWTSTRTNRRAAAAVAAAALELSGMPSVVEAVRKAEGRASARASLRGGEEVGASSTVKAEEEEEESESSALSARGLVKGVKAAATADDKVKKGVPRTATTTAAAAQVKGKGGTAAKRVRSPSSASSSNSSSASDKEDENDEEGKGRRETSTLPKSRTATAASQKAQTSTTADDAASAAKTAEKGGETKAEVGDASITKPATSTAAATSKTAKKPSPQPQQPPKEEHRGRPRGTFKYPRLVDGVLVGGTAARAAEKKRGEAAASAAAAASLAKSQTSIAVSSSNALHGAAATKAGESGKALPSPREMPLGLNAHQRSVRTRVQQRMGVPLPTAAPPPPLSSSVSDTADDSTAAPSTTVYSSYTFLLSSFAAHATSAAAAKAGGTTAAEATTAPVVWYGPAAGPSASASAARGRGRRRRVEGGVDRTVLGPALRHDQAALEREVKARLTEETATKPSASLLAAEASLSTSADVKVALMKNEEGDEMAEAQTFPVDTANSALLSHLVPSSFSEREDAVNRTSSPTSPPNQTGSPTSPATAAAKPQLLQGQQCAPAQTPSQPPPIDFAELSYAQQCLLVWTAGGLLERHARQRREAEARRARLLARCGRMATRRMAARVAEVVESRIKDDGGDEKEGEEERQLAAGSDGEGSDASHSDSDSDDGRGGREGTIAAMTRAGVRKGEKQRSGRAEDAAEQSDSDTSSVSSAETRRLELRPAPRRVFDYWAAYRALPAAGPLAGSVASAGVKLEAAAEHVGR